MESNTHVKPLQSFPIEELTPNQATTVAAEDVPGVIVEDGVPKCWVAGRLWPVTAAVYRRGVLIPIVDIPLVDDVKKSEAANE